MYSFLKYKIIVFMLILAVGILGANPKSFESIQQQFKYSDVLNITNNFTRIRCKGGFGKVYHGYIGHTQVAVKMLSPSSVQGYQEFEAEASKSNLYFLSIDTFSYKINIGYFLITDETSYESPS